MAESEHTKELHVRPSQIGIKVLLVTPEDEILLLKRNPDAYGDGKSYWDIPGGRVESEVDIATLTKGGAVPSELTRELKEEIGWSQDNSKALTLVAHQQITTSTNQPVDRLTFALPVDKNIQVKLSREHTEYKWVPVRELGNIADLGSALQELVNQNKIPHNLR